MNNLTDWGNALVASFTDVWFEIIDSAPIIAAAIIVFVAGIFVSRAFGRLIAKVLNQLYIDKASEKTGLKSILDKFGFKMEISRALGLLVTWFLYAVILIATAEILNLDQISQFLQSIVSYIPNVIAAVVILVVGIIVSNFAFTLVKEASLSAKLAAADFLANVAKWAIMVFTVMAALIQLRVAAELIQILFTGLIFMLALAGGIAFGLGGKDKARDFLDKLTRK